MKKLKIGLVCPYGWDTPGGVQNHVRDLAEFFIAEGHYVSVLAPATDDSDLPPYLVNAGKPTGIPFIAPIVESKGPNRGARKPRPNSAQRRRRPR